ncbi:MULTISPECIES: head maturation protease, ClpP-related [unclassified Rhodococcus (in: high G+C Gram-positive bacteria)]|uniref:head maturation protease, ClpP-related n=1 Tax=unclassified Rhodococcus (in: high G+C Gram-positive bacteria) TaxID=192944 RepID=UPI000B9BE44B|nr:MULTISPECIES: head maturation protease, ClpP-related [unclassified Rhodococcus (in: high G+C Gram-positive bacteria)]OZE35612.1 hypothetical protein CH259_16420 [Rhodococcus sp. 05-2254-4]OZE48041.1 hypothetical protein CH261_09015 [Rhodococcus sp. 05-2254-3]OZE49252.1 hypothetical protein CH283_16800 [Rhodococcus sp. 05-2254-2]
MNPFLRNRQAFKRTPVKAEIPQTRSSDNGTTAVLRLYDPIDSWGEFWGVSAKEFVAAIDELPEKTTEIQLLINSPGGEVWEGLAILNALRRHDARVVAIVEGIAASSASFIAAGVDELRIMENAEFFIHNAWGMCVGNAADMTKMSADLEHEDRNIASIYARKTGGDVDTWLEAMKNESWYSAEEAVAAGLADSVFTSDAVDETPVQKAKNRFDLSALARNGHRPTNSSANEAGDPEDKESVMDTLKEGLAERFGFGADADDETVLKAIDEALEEQTVEPVETPPVVEAAEPTLESALAVIQKNGLGVVENAALTELIAKAERGDQARAQQMQEANNAVIDTAIREGRIAPASREQFLNLLTDNPEGTRKLIDQLPKNLVPVEESGHGQSPANAVEEDLGWFNTRSKEA